MSKAKALVMKPIDNVATATEEIVSGTDVLINTGFEDIAIHVIDRIPFGHKFALQDIAAGEKIIKYGEVIGVATSNIHKGQHTHVHNLGACRGRGDLQR